MSGLAFVVNKIHVSNFANAKIKKVCFFFAGVGASRGRAQ